MVSQLPVAFILLLIRKIQVTRGLVVSAETVKMIFSSTVRKKEFPLLFTSYNADVNYLQLSQFQGLTFDPYAKVSRKG